MEIRIRESGQVVWANEFRAMFPNVGQRPLIKDVLDEFGADVVLEGPQAQPTRYQIAFRDGVYQIEDNWYTKYSVADLDAEGIALRDAEQAKAVRSTRNALIAECDWTQLADSPADKEVWANYRQALRDLPSQEGFPWDMTYPTKP